MTANANTPGPLLRIVAYRSNQRSERMLRYFEGQDGTVDPNIEANDPADEEELASALTGPCHTLVLEGHGGWYGNEHFSLGRTPQRGSKPVPIVDLATPDALLVTGLVVVLSCHSDRARNDLAGCVAPGHLRLVNDDVGLDTSRLIGARIAYLIGEHPELADLPDDLWALTLGDKKRGAIEVPFQSLCAATRTKFVTV